MSDKTIECNACGSKLSYHNIRDHVCRPAPQAVPLKLRRNCMTCGLEAGLDVRYRALETEAEALAGALETLQAKVTAWDGDLSVMHAADAALARWRKWKEKA